MAGYLIGGRLVASGELGPGEITVRAVPLTSGDFELPLNNDGSLDVDVTLPMVDPITKTEVDLAELLVPGRDYIGWVEQTKPGDPAGDIVIEAGPIWNDPTKMPTDGRMIANGILSYFDHRLVMPVLKAGQLPRNVTTKITGLSNRTIMKRLVQQAIAHRASGIPIRFEPDYPGTDQIEIPGSDRKFVAEALRDIAELEGGPDFTFRPRLSDDRRSVEWSLLTGDPELTQAGVEHYWDLSVKEPHAKITDHDRDATSLASRDYQFGASIRNMLSDGSFEDGGAASWVAGENAKDVIFPDWGGYHGTARAEWVSVASGPAHLDYKSKPSVEPGETRSLLARVRTQTINVEMRALLQWRDVNGDIIAAMRSGTKQVGPDAWEELYVTGVAPEGARTVHVSVYANAPAGDRRFYADAMMLYDLDERIPFAVDDHEVQAVTEHDALLDAGFPLLEQVTNRSSVRRDDTIKAYGREAVLRASAHVETLTIVAKRDKTPMLGTYWPGDYAYVNVGANHRLKPGRHRVRIVGMQFGRTGDVTIQCAPERVVSGYPVPSTARTWLRDRLRALHKTVMETTRGR